VVVVTAGREGKHVRCEGLILAWGRCCLRRASPQRPRPGAGSHEPPSPIGAVDPRSQCLRPVMSWWYPAPQGPARSSFQWLCRHGHGSPRRLRCRRSRHRPDRWKRRSGRYEAHLRGRYSRHLRRGIRRDYDLIHNALAKEGLALSFWK
jgi:hypothetical protein